MQIIHHRRNTIDALLGTDPRFGVEVDVRSQGQRLVIHHDPFCDGVDFGEWIEHYQHGTLILNVKEEGLERALLAAMKARDIENFFFLDQSFPFLVRTSGSGERRSAVRVSEFEDVETALSLAGRIDWVWVDCFTRFPLTNTSATALKEAGFKLCLVSPELQGRPAEAEIAGLKALLASENIIADAVCTKRPDLWGAP